MCFCLLYCYYYYSGCVKTNCLPVLLGFIYDVVLIVVIMFCLDIILLRMFWVDAHIVYQDVFYAYVIFVSVLIVTISSVYGRTQL